MISDFKIINNGDDFIEQLQNTGETAFDKYFCSMNTNYPLFCSLIIPQQNGHI